MTTEIVELLDQLKTAREHAAGVRAEKKAMIEEVQASAAFRALDEATSEADATIEELENDIRAKTLELYQADQELPDRVGVKLWPVVTVHDEKAAREWAFTNLRKALKLDIKVFESEVKDKNSEVPPEIATVTKEPRPFIATKL